MKIVWDLICNSGLTQMRLIVSYTGGNVWFSVGGSQSAGRWLYGISRIESVAIWHQKGGSGGYMASAEKRRWLCGMSGVADANLSLGEDYLMTPRALTQPAERGLSRGKAPLWSQLKCVM